MARHRIMAAAAAALLAAMSAAHAAGSDAVLFGKEPGKGNVYACFTRRYDAGHLAAHPKQNVSDMALLVKTYVGDDNARQYELEIGVHFRRQATLFQLSGECDAAAGGKAALSCGFDCDGGHIDVKVKDAQAILVAIPDGARTWDPSSSAEPPPNARFASDDKLFRLDRASLKDCLPEALDDDAKADLAKAE